MTIRDTRACSRFSTYRRAEEGVRTREAPPVEGSRYVKNHDGQKFGRNLALVSLHYLSNREFIP